MRKHNIIPVNDFIRSRRINERKNYRKEVFFSSGSMIFNAEINNISMEGANITSTNISKIKTGKEIFIAIPFAIKPGSIKRKAIVQWTQNDQFGIKFNQRINARINYQKEVMFSTGTMIFPGHIKDISRGGAHVSCGNISIIKTPVVITISIPFAKKQGDVKKKAMVRWALNDQFGVKFI